MLKIKPLKNCLNSRLAHSIKVNNKLSMDESVSALGEIRDLLKDQNSDQKPPSLMELADRSLRR